MEIRYWNRARAREEIENVYGEKWLQRGYGSALGRGLVDHFLSKPWLSRLYGAVQSTRLSGAKVAPFVRAYQIPMELYEPGPFPTFNDFFIRKFKPGVRPFPREAKKMGSFAEARMLAFNPVDSQQTFPVKGQYLSARGFLGPGADAARWSATFEGGALWIARLCPVDYHRFHFPDDGEVKAHWRVPGVLHSVNPIAWEHAPDLFHRNERQVTILETRQFGALAMIEIGALCVGRILQTYGPKTPSASVQVSRGSEKGYFLFGGSCVVLLAQPGKVVPSADLLANSAKHQETLVELGSVIGQTPGLA